MKIYLIGYMGSGKTTIGRPLARKFGYKFVDMDSAIVERHKCSIAEIFEQQGEDKFRQIEAETLRELPETENIVISTGGGTPCFNDNMEFMNHSGVTIYLKVSPKMLVDRLENGKEKRPLLRGKSKAELLDFVSQGLTAREKYYSQATITIDCNGYSDTKIVEIIVMAIKELSL